MQQIQHLEMSITLVLMAIFISISNLFIYCYFGKIATNSFMKISLCLYESDWQNQPLNIQKHFIVMIANAQRPLFYHGYHMSVLNLETFTKVSKACFSFSNSTNSCAYQSFNCSFPVDKHSFQLFYAFQNTHRIRKTIEKTKFTCIIQFI